MLTRVPDNTALVLLVLKHVVVARISNGVNVGWQLMSGLLVVQGLVLCRVSLVSCCTVTITSGL